jgi:hypothetical protein
VREALVEASIALRFEAGLASDTVGFAVEARTMSSGTLRPTAVIDRGVRREVREVLGMLHEETVSHVLVRTDGPREMLLQYDRVSLRWNRG